MFDFRVVIALVIHMDKGARHVRKQLELLLKRLADVVCHPVRVDYYIYCTVHYIYSTVYGKKHVQISSVYWIATVLYKKQCEE